MKKNSVSLLLPSIGGILLALLLLGIYRYAAFPDFENSRDCLYHVRIALEGWDTFAAKQFPATTLSSWGTCFADKELLFHILLGYVQTGVILSGVPEFPFHIPSLFFCGLLLCGFAFAGHAFKIKQMWFFLPLLIFVEPIFLQRILMVRPHVLSIALMLFSCFLFQRIRSPRQIFLPILLGWCYAWSYSNPHFLLFSSIAFAFPLFFRNRARSMTIFFGSLAGLLLSFLLHPQFPNTFINWKIQCIDVPWNMLFTTSSSVVAGDEILFSGFRNLLILTFLPLLGIGNLLLCISAFRRKKRRFFIPETSALLILAGGSFFGALFFFRMIEYAMPFNLLFFGYLLTRERRIAATALLRRHRAAFNAICILFLLAVSVICFVRIDRVQGIKSRPLPQITKWLSDPAKFPPGILIGNVNWSDFPTLYYTMPQNRYLCGLDPTFGSAAFPERMRDLEKFRTGRLKLSPKALFALTGTALFYVAPQNTELARDMFNSGFKIGMQNDEGWIFFITKEQIQ